MNTSQLTEWDILDESLIFFHKFNLQTLRYLYLPQWSIMNEDNQQRFGFVNFAETWNGRMAMMGILIGLGTELITGQSILRQIGIG